MTVSCLVFRCDYSDLLLESGLQHTSARCGGSWRSTQHPANSWLLLSEGQPPYADACGNPKDCGKMSWGGFCLRPLHTAWHERAGDLLACSSMDIDIAEGYNIPGSVLDAIGNVRCFQLVASCSDLSLHTARRCRPLLTPAFQGDAQRGSATSTAMGPLRSQQQIAAVIALLISHSAHGNVRNRSTQALLS